MFSGAWKQSTPDTLEPKHTQTVADDTYTFSGCQAGHWAFILMTVRTSSPYRTTRTEDKKENFDKVDKQWKRTSDDTSLDFMCRRTVNK